MDISEIMRSFSYSSGTTKSNVKSICRHKWRINNHYKFNKSKWLSVSKSLILGLGNNSIEESVINKEFVLTEG